MECCILKASIIHWSRPPGSSVHRAKYDVRPCRRQRTRTCNVGGADRPIPACKLNAEHSLSSALLSLCPQHLCRLHTEYERCPNAKSTGITIGVTAAAMFVYVYKSERVCRRRQREISILSGVYWANSYRSGGQHSVLMTRRENDWPRRSRG